jgi:hypothetical protein
MAALAATAPPGSPQQLAPAIREILHIASALPKVPEKYEAARLGIGHDMLADHPLKERHGGIEEIARSVDSVEFERQVSSDNSAAVDLSILE